MYHKGDRPEQKLSHVPRVGINMNTLYATRIMSDFNITELFDSLSHEAKFFLILGLLHAKGYSNSTITLTFNAETSCWFVWNEERWGEILVSCHRLNSMNL